MGRISSLLESNAEFQDLLSSQACSYFMFAPALEQSPARPVIRPRFTHLANRITPLSKLRRALTLPGHRTWAARFSDPARALGVDEPSHIKSSSVPQT
jgi:hypothetical protein